jgi:hypothetical protein
MPVNFGLDPGEDLIPDARIHDDLRRKQMGKGTFACIDGVRYGKMTFP